MLGVDGSRWWIFNVAVIGARDLTFLEKIGCFSWFYLWAGLAEIASAPIAVLDIQCVHWPISTLFTIHLPCSIAALLS